MRELTALAAFAAATAVACAPKDSSGELRVVVTIPPLAGFVDRLSPGPTEITILIPPGASPVTHEPTLSDRRAAARADLYVSVGHPALTWERSWLTQLTESRAGAGRVHAADGCEFDRDDPHVWLSTSCARSMASAIAASLAGARPGQRKAIEANLKTLTAVIDSVDAAASARLAPRRGRAFIALHPAWGYLARRHGLEQLAILEHGSGDAGPARLAAIIERARLEGLTAVIVQPQFNVEPARLVARELGGRTVSADPLARDWVEIMRGATAALAEATVP